jgi:GTPase SAR1 family protein
LSLALALSINKKQLEVGDRFSPRSVNPTVELNIRIHDRVVSMGCGQSKDVKKPRRPVTPPPSNGEAVLSYSASGRRQSGAVPEHNDITSFDQSLQSPPNRLAKVSAPQGTKIDATPLSPESTTISRMHQDILLYMNHGAGENLRFSCWDFGGQDTFYGLHHLYMGRNSVYVLMFNMEWFLVESERDWSKHLDFLAFWLNSIAAHAADPKDHSMAPIILVGSHKDLVPDPKEHERISEMLFATFQSVPAWSRGVQRKDSLCFFPVDNTRGSKDPVITEITKTVQEVVNTEKYIKEQIPFTWLKVLERLQEKDRPSCLDFNEDLVKICQECGMPSTPGASVEDEALVMLKIFNDLGQVMHHSEATLRHLVILDPANYLVEPASRIICQHSIHENLNEFLKKARKKEDKLLTKLQQKGILDPKLLDIVWEDRLKDKQDLLTLSVKFGFFVPLLRQVEATDTKVSAGDLYLVPAILPKRLTIHQSTATTPKLVGYLFFALKDTMEGFRKEGYVQLQEVKRDGFFPMGLGSAVMGQIVSECQLLYNLTLNDMQLSATEIFTAFGQHKFVLRTNVELQMMELCIMVDSSFIADRVLDLVEKAIKKMVPTLEVALAVHQGGGVCSNGLVAETKPETPLIILSGPCGLQDKVKNGTAEFSVGPGEKWNSVKTKKTFEKWLPPEGLLEQGYDCFFSYRWTTKEWGGMDTELVDGIYHKSLFTDRLVGERQVQVFLDRHRLEDGRRFDKDFVKALLKSTVVVPIVSCAALQKMASLKKDSPIDNLFVEWVIVAELQEIGALEFCIPVMLGTVFETPQKDGKFISNIFTEGSIAQLPKVVVSEVVSFVQEVFDVSGIAPSKHLHTRTVKDTVETIIKNLGVKAWDVRVQTSGIPTRHNDGGKSDVHIQSEWQRNLFTAVFDKFMECLEKAEKLGKSKVTQMSASTQLDRDLKALFESHGLSELQEKVCDALGAKCVQDVAMADDEDIETLTWLKPIERKKLKKLITDSKTGDSTKEEIPVISSISSGKDKSDDHNDTEKDTKGDRDKDVSENQKRWESISAERAEECLREAMRIGSKPLNTSRLNIVGEGRAGKTAWLRAVSNKAFEETPSTIGVKQSLLEVNKVDMETKCEGGWSVVEEGTLIMKADEAMTRVAAEIAVTQPQVCILDRNKDTGPCTLSCTSLVSWHRMLMPMPCFSLLSLVTWQDFSMTANDSKLRIIQMLEHI